MAKHTATTKDITTPRNGHVVTLKEWITGRDMEYINAVYLAGTKVKPTANGSMEFGAIDIGDKSTEATHRAIEKWVVAVDGVKENILDDVLDMHEVDTKAVLSAIDELSKKK